METTHEGRLAGRRVAITGAGTGIGKAVALRAAHEGATLALLCNRSVDRAEALALAIKEDGGEAHVIQADLATIVGVDRAAVEIEVRLGAVDCLANVAGATDVLEPAWAEASDLERLEHILAVDVRGTVLLTWAIVERMRAGGGGSVVNTSWDGALGGEATGTAGVNGRASELFGIAKGAVTGFTRNLARTAAPTVRVNEVAPGYIGTEYFHEENDERRDYVDRCLAATPLRRLGSVDDVAAAFCFLMSDDASYVTGQTIIVNGGAYA